MAVAKQGPTHPIKMGCSLGPDDYNLRFLGCIPGWPVSNSISNLVQFQTETLSIGICLAAVNILSHGLNNRVIRGRMSAGA